MTPLAQAILNAFDSRSRDALQQVVDRVQALEKRLSCTCPEKRFDSNTGRQVHEPHCPARPT